MSDVTDQPHVPRDDGPGDRKSSLGRPSIWLHPQRQAAATSGSTGAVSTERASARRTGSGLDRGVVTEHSSGAGTASTDWPLISQLELGPLATAIGCGRHHARHVLIEWGLNLLVDDAVLLVSELLTNALKASWALTTPTPIVLRLLANERQLIIEAWDQWVADFELREVLEAQWTTRLADLLEDDPGVEADLRALVEQIQAGMSASDHAVGAGRDMNIGGGVKIADRGGVVARDVHGSISTGNPPTPGLASS